MGDIVPTDHQFIHFSMGSLRSNKLFQGCLWGKNVEKADLGEQGGAFSGIFVYC